MWSMDPSKKKKSIFQIISFKKKREGEEGRKFIEEVMPENFLNVERSGYPIL